MKNSLFFFPARIIFFIGLFFSNRPIRPQTPVINYVSSYTLPSHTAMRTNNRTIFEYSVSYDNLTLFSIFGLDSLFCLWNLNKAATKTMASEITQKIENYIKETTWPAIKENTRDLVKEISQEVTKQIKENIPPAKTSIDVTMTSSIKKIFLAGAGLALVATGGQLVNQALTNTTKKRSKKPDPHRLFLFTIGSGMILAGMGAILFCDSITNYITPAA